jgi:hypothetical protein
MRSPSVAPFLIAFACAWPARAERVSVGVSVRRDDSCMRGTYTGEREGPRDAFAEAGREFGCDDENSLIRQGLGVVVAVPLSRRWALRADPGLATGGYQYYSKSLTLVRLDYLQGPLHARFLLVPAGILRPYLLAGVFAAKRRNPDVTADDISSSSRPGDSFYGARKELWRGWNVGASGGGGLLFRATPLEFFGEVVFERGLVDVYEGRNLDRHTRTMRVAGGFTFRVGR